ncbi:MAG: lytic polysaccharide monooxygenase [Phycisphaerales bacterium]
MRIRNDNPVRLVSVLATLGALAPATTVVGHGSMASPVSRVYNGFLEGPENPTSAAIQAAIEVGGTQPFYDWNQVTHFFPGSPEFQSSIDYSQYILDGTIASGGNSKYAGLDLVRDDWEATAIVPGPFQFVWDATTPHDPSVFHAWITTPDWNPSMPLNWAQLTPLALGPVSLLDHQYRFSAVLPARNGKHCIYVVWQRIDPAGESFHSLSDVDFGAGGAPGCPADFDLDGTIGGADLAHVLASWGTGAGDLDGDGLTDGADLALVLSAWGSCGPDCDGDGISDAEEIANGASDCNADGIPDECQALADCDGDGILDVCAILGGLVDDCNMNLVPDSCEIADGGDANGDGFLDACQLGGLTFDWQVTDQWGSGAGGGFIASLTINNDSGEMIHGWQLAFDTPGYTIANLWNGVLLSQGGGEALVANETWNEHLDDGASVTIGFQGLGQPSAPTTVVLNQSPVAPGG